MQEETPASNAPSESGAPAPDESQIDAAAQSEADEWQAAQDELFPGLKEANDKKAKEDGDEQAKSEKDPKEGAEGKKPKDPKKPDEKLGTGDDTGAKGEDAKGNRDKSDEKDDDEGAGDEEQKTSEQPDRSAYNTRLAAREYQSQVADVAKDVREKMYADAPTELTDKDGDPIRTIEDVMQLVDPRTGEGFTEEAATAFLMNAQQQFNRQVTERDKEIERIAEVQVDLADEAKSIMYRYGELFKTMPELQKEIYADFELTLTKDPDTGIITNMPISLEKYYDNVLRPYVKMAEKAEADEAAKSDQEAKDKAAKDKQNKQDRNERSDIYSPSADADTTDPDTKEWAAANKAYFDNN